jgi:hypothetical protein
MEMSLEERINTVGRRLRCIARQLAAMGYRFDDPAAVFPGAAVGTDTAIERIEREIGPVPRALGIFWRQVGSVNFMGEHADWEGCDYPDPIVIFPPSYALDELGQFIGDRAERMRCNLPYLIPVSPDALHKENVSGGMWYNVSMPATVDDPPLNDEPHSTTFVSYLELAVRWGGFPGLDRCPEHNWPLTAIAGGAVNER